MRRSRAVRNGRNARGFVDRDESVLVEKHLDRNLRAASVTPPFREGYLVANLHRRGLVARAECADEDPPFANRRAIPAGPRHHGPHGRPVALSHDPTNHVRPSVDLIALHRSASARLHDYAVARMTAWLVPLESLARRRSDDRRAIGG